MLLDAQVTEFDGGVLVNWDVREDAFPEGVIDAMFDRHVDELRRLAADDASWEIRARTAHHRRATRGSRRAQRENRSPQRQFTACGLLRLRHRTARRSGAHRIRR